MNIDLCLFEKIVEDGVLCSGCDDRTGIYCVHNRINNKVYVGSSSSTKGFRARMLNHFVKTRKPTLLTKAIVKYGSKNFDAYIISVINDISNIGGAEIGAIAAFQSLAPNGYNLTIGGKGTTGFSSVSGADKNRGKPNPGVSLANAKCYKIVSPEGVVHNIRNMTAFANARGLNPSHLMAVANRRPGCHSCGGWTNGHGDTKDYMKRLSTQAYFVSPEGIVVSVRNINRFSKHKGLQQGAMNALWRKKKSYNQHHGWRRATEEQIAVFDEYSSPTWDYDRWLIPLTV